MAALSLLSPSGRSIISCWLNLTARGSLSPALRARSLGSAFLPVFSGHLRARRNNTPHFGKPCLHSLKSHSICESCRASLCPGSLSEPASRLQHPSPSEKALTFWSPAERQVPGTFPVDGIKDSEFLCPTWLPHPHTPISQQPFLKKNKLLKAAEP